MSLAILAVLIIIFLISTMVLVKSICIVESRYVVFVERLGRYYRTLSEGRFFIVPFMDKIAGRLFLGEEVLDIPSENFQSGDGKNIQAEGYVTIQVEYPLETFYGIQDYKQAVLKLSHTVMRNMFSSRDLQSVLLHPDSLEENMAVSQLQEPFEGKIKILGFEISSVKEI